MTAGEWVRFAGFLVLLTGAFHLARLGLSARALRLFGPAPLGSPDRPAEPPRAAGLRADDGLDALARAFPGLLTEDLRALERDAGLPPRQTPEPSTAPWATGTVEGLPGPLARILARLGPWRTSGAGLMEGIPDGLRAQVADAEIAEGYAPGHADRVGEGAMRLALALGFPEALAQRAWAAGYLHDVGEVGLADVLLHPGPLPPGHRARLQGHPVGGARLAARLGPEVADGIRAHHERLDGQGYPRGLAGEAIPLLGRMVAVADAWEALTHRRPYRDPFTPQEAAAELMALAGTAYDPLMVRTFLREVVPQLPGS